VFYYLLFPLLGGAIGWVTNYLAIKFLFRPRSPLKVGPLLIQGVIPRRRQELARAVGEVVATELLSREQIASALNSPEIRANVAEIAGEVAGRRVSNYQLLSPLPRGLRERIAASVDNTIAREVSAILSSGGPDMADRMLASLDLASLVEAKLEGMDWDYMEAIVYSVSGRELKLIEVMGGVLGAMVGLIQALVVYLF
jgi:uncharacterized membrane protein YheB (UPF0754 family)